MHCSAQNFTGKGDKKLQVGANFQDNASGILVSYDIGLGENISVGLASSYALGVNSDIDADFGDRFDLKARFNANIGNVLNIDDNFDFYPGLNLGLRNFGAHVGARYFFTEGFGIFTEVVLPIAKYDTSDLTPAEEINNQFTFNIGATFNLN
jgi:hypothetical protein